MDDESARLREVEQGAKAQRILSDPYFDGKCTELKNGWLMEIIKSPVGEGGDQLRRDTHNLMVALEALLGRFRTDIETAKLAQHELEIIRSKKKS